MLTCVFPYSLIFGNYGILVNKAMHSTVSKREFNFSIELADWLDSDSSWKWYFVTKIIMTYCEKKLFYWSRKTFEIWGWRPRICKGNFLLQGKKRLEDKKVPKWKWRENPKKFLTSKILPLKMKFVANKISKNYLVYWVYNTQ